MRILMKMMMAVILGCVLSSSTPNSGVLKLISSSDQMEPYTTGYADATGKIVIPIGKYRYCFTQVFDKIAFIGEVTPEDNEPHCFAIDRAENILFEIATWDNGPDEVQDGLFRIIVDSKWGFANMNGEIVIQPTFTSVMPFSEGLAAFNIGGEKVKVGDYTAIKGGKCGFVNTKGTIVIPAVFDDVRSFRDGRANVNKDGESFEIDKTGSRIN